MFTQRRLYLLLFTVLGLTAAFAGARASAWGQPPAARPLAVDLRALQKNPGQYRMQRVAFVGRFAKEGGLFRQGGIFSGKRHANFMVWAAEAPLWDKNGRQQILSSLYLSRENEAALNVLHALNRYDTVKITGTVEEVYANLPWISVEQIVPVAGEHLDDAMLQQVAQGRDYLKSGNREKAQLCFEMATGQGAPAFVRQYIQNLTADYAPQRTIEEKPVENFMPLVEAAREAARNSDMREAEKLYRSAQDKCADNAWLYKEIGLFYEYEYAQNHNPEKLSQALRSYEKAEMLNGAPDADIHFLQARATFTRDRESRDLAAAEALVNKCLKMNREHAMARRLAAEITAEKISYDPAAPAEKAPAAAVAAIPENTGSALNTIDNRPVAAAEPKLPAKPQSVTLSAEQHLQIGSTLARNQNFASAVKHLEAAAAGESACAGEARRLLASTRDALHRQENARAEKNAPAAAAEKPGRPAQPAASVPALSVADLEMEKLGADMDALNFEVDNVRKSVAAEPRESKVALAEPARAGKEPAPLPAAAPEKPARAEKAPAPLVTPKNVSLEEIPDWAL